jgi:hypothetical protein
MVFQELDLLTSSRHTVFFVTLYISGDHWDQTWNLLNIRLLVIYKVIAKTVSLMTTDHLKMEIEPTPKSHVCQIYLRQWTVPSSVFI